MPHDRPLGTSASHDPESGPLEGGCESSTRRRRRSCRIERVGLQRRSPGSFCGLQGANNKGRGDSLPPESDAYVQARNAPDGSTVYRPQAPLTVEPRQVRPGSKLAPAYRPIVNKCEKAGWRTVLHNLAKVSSILLSTSFAVKGANPKVHAPATTTGSLVVKEILERVPVLGRERTNGDWARLGEFHNFIIKPGSRDDPSHSSVTRVPRQPWPPLITERKLPPKASCRVSRARISRRFAWIIS